VGRRHPVAGAVEQQTREQARLARAGVGVALGGVGGELGLSRIPQRLVDDRLVFAGVGLRVGIIQQAQGTDTPSFRE